METSVDTIVEPSLVERLDLLERIVRAVAEDALAIRQQLVALDQKIEDMLHEVRLLKRTTYTPLPRVRPETELVDGVEPKVG